MMGLMMLLAMPERVFYMMKELVSEDEEKVKQISGLKIKTLEELSKLEASLPMMGLMMLLATPESEKGFYMMFERAKELVREDKEKVKQISDLKIKAVEELSKLEAEIKALRVKIHELMELSDAKEEEIRKLHDRLVELEAKMHRTKFSYKMQLRKILGPEKFKELHRRHRMIKIP